MESCENIPETKLHSAELKLIDRVNDYLPLLIFLFF